MRSAKSFSDGLPGLGLIVVLFGVLLLASQANELLKQIVISPGSTAELGVAAHCRADELEEEQLSLEECQLMVSNIQITLASSPSWFRSFQIFLSSLGVGAAVFSIIVGSLLVNGVTARRKLALFCFALLVLIDVAGFVSATNTGPLLRAQYLWPLLLWFFIHLCMLVAMLTINNPLHEQRN